MFSSSPRYRKIEISGTVSETTINNALKKAFAVFVIKAIISIIVVFIGSYFIYSGIQSDAIITLKFNSLNLELNKALPGVTLVIFGIVLLIFSNTNLKITNN